MYNMSSENNEVRGSPDLVDMLLGKRGEIVIDSETMIMETQKRVWGALKKGYEYTGVIDDSEKFLRENVFKKINNTNIDKSTSLCATVYKHQDRTDLTLTYWNHKHTKVNF